jgi:hypothetical protein
MPGLEGQIKKKKYLSQNPMFLKIVILGQFFLILISPDVRGPLVKDS